MCIRDSIKSDKVTLGKHASLEGSIISELDPDGQMIFGRGDLDSELFFCGEAPNEEDEKAGSAFGGPAGELLGKIIEAMGFPTSSVYISNILHWKPKYELSFGHRPPTQSEINFAMPFLKAQIEIVKPKNVETTAIGACKVAMLSSGKSIENLSKNEISYKVNKDRRDVYFRNYSKWQEYPTTLKNATTTQQPHPQRQNTKTQQRHQTITTNT
mgnify:CR=1 FL=1